ncbi:hypothetical protein Unana1_00729 [Umbelopsis nana]
MASSETEHHTLWYTNPEARLWTTSVKPTDAILAYASEEDGEPIELIAATAGNHGRAVARMAKMLGIQSHIFVPQTTTPRSCNYIASEGGQMIVVPGSYELAVEETTKAVAEPPSKAIHMQDVAWPGYETIPLHIVDGYSTLFHEVDEQLAQAGSPPVSLIAIPVGCGPLAHAGVKHYRKAQRSLPAPVYLTVEPSNAACLLHSLKQGKLTSIETGNNIMPGVDAAITVNDVDVDRAVHDLAKLKIFSVSCGVSTLAAMRTLLTDASFKENSQGMGLGPDSVIVLVSTEGNQTYLGEEAS